ncbi:MAG: ABC transporter substrate-binding protein [Oscillospiraceae bacterium]|nr:ABC transporter substrate-binding protein [Oscillospiraceae bacterium]
MKKAISLFLSLVMLCAVLCACGDGSGKGDEGSNGLQDARKAANEIVVAIAQDPEDSLDPHAAASAGTREVLFNIYEGLVKTGPTGELIPAVAESYKVSEDGLVYTFTLREGVKFHNGEPVTAEDVIYSLNRCAEHSGDSALKSAFSAICDLQAMDEKTVSFRLEQPDMELIYFMTAAIIPANSDQLSSYRPGTGPFVLTERTPQESIVLERFADYWGEQAGVEKVTYRIYEDMTALMMALKGGSVDVCAHLTSAQTAQLGEAFTILEDTMNLVQAVYLNNAVEPFNNVKVRQALSYAIDRQMIMDVVFDGHGAAIGSNIYPKLERYFMPELVEYYPCDPDKAKALLVEAGYPDGFDMTITVSSNYQPHMDTAEVVVQQLAAIGVRAKVQPVDATTWYSEAYTNRQFQSTITGLDAKNITARAMLERFVSDNGKNFMNYNNPAYDALYQQARSATDEDTQTAAYKAMERMLTEDAANLYIQDMADFVAVRPDLQGYTFYPIYAQDLAKLHYAD